MSIDRYESKENPNLLDAAALVNLMASVGPGASLSVRVYSKDGTSTIGRTAWKDDRVGGPAVIFLNPENKNQDLIIPLGGQVKYDSPPRISTLLSHRTVGNPFGEVRAHQSPIDPIARGYSFEVVSE